MAQHRYRQNKIKREHTIIEGILPVLEEIAEHPHVQGITPGRINHRSSNRNAAVTFQYKTDAGLKLLARNTTAVQEVFVVTDRPDQVLADLARQELIKAPASDKQKKRRAARKRTEQGPPPPDRPERPEDRSGSEGAKADRPAAQPSGQAAPAQVESAQVESGQVEPGQVEPGQAESGQAKPAPRTAPGPRARPEVGDAIDQELKEQMMSLARQGAGAATPAPKKEPNRPTNVWRELVKAHRELLALEEPPHDLD